MSSYAEASAEVSDQNAAPLSGGHGSCYVNGCPLRGTLSSSTNGASEWSCCVHFGASPGEYGGITTRIRSRVSLFKLAYRLINAPPARLVPTKVADEIRALGRPEMLTAKSPVKGRALTVQSLGASMLRILEGECRSPQSAVREATTKPVQPADTWQSATAHFAELV